MAQSGSRTVMQMWKFLTEEKVGFEQVLKKVNLVKAMNGECRAEMKVDEEHTNRAGKLHGGLTCTLVDVVSSVALATVRNGDRGVSVDLHVSFYNPVSLGEQIFIDGKVIKGGKNLAFLEVLISEPSGNIIAKGLHTKFLSSKSQ